MDPVDVRRFSREEYGRMARAGILRPDERVELIDGEIVRESPQSGPHARGIRAVEETLRRVFTEGYDIRVQLPLALDLLSEPEPDISVIPGSWRDYREDHPSSAVLVVEVAATATEYDRVRKGSLYARAQIPEYWVLDLEGRRLEIYCDPTPSQSASYGWAYRSVRSFGAGERICPATLADTWIAVDDLLA